MQYFKVINTNTREEKFFKANNMFRVLAHLVKHETSDWVYGVNIIEVNADKSRKERGDFLCEAIRDYFVSELDTNDDKVILNDIYQYAFARSKGWR